MRVYLDTIKDSKCIKLLLVFIVLDVIFGILRAIKEREINSTIGIDGIIRKFGMILASLGFLVVDVMVGFNMIGFLPQEIREYLPLQIIGISSFFNILFIIFEALSILKNMVKCGLPIPKKIQVLLKRLLKDFTSEIKEEEAK